jgi:ubiquinone biosynthesis protein
MPIPRPDRGFQNLRRYRQIATVLIKHGFGELVYRMNLGAHILPKRRKGPVEPITDKSTPHRVRLALEELGPTFVKLGQVLSTRPFLLPADYIIELSKLQDEVEPMPWSVASTILVRELGCPVEQCFSSFEQQPLASASLAQVHKAILNDGTPVVVKIQRLGIKKIIDSDMRILRDVAEMLERNVPESQQFEPKGLVEELARSTQKEINFLNEARNIEIFADNFKEEPGIKVPEVYRQFTTSKILTLEMIKGIKISRIEELKKAGYDTEKICQYGSRMILKMIFEDGFFHADPHPGNLFVCENEVIAPVDYGMMGSLSKSQMDELGDLVLATMSRDATEIIRVLQNVEVVPANADLRLLEQDLSELIIKYYHMSLAHIDMSTAMDDFFSVAQRYGIRFRSEFMLLGKALMTYEELARMLFPGYNFVAEIGPYLKRLTVRKFQPSKFFKDIFRILDELRWLMVESPREWRRITDKLSKGELQVKMQHRGLDTLIREMDRSSNRLSISLLVAALIVGSSLIMTVKEGVMLFDFPLLGLVGYLFAGILGIFLVISILRSGKL